MEEFPEIKGIIANKGYVSGPARIVLSEKDFSKIQFGDIIIMKAMVHEFLPALKDCVALISDEDDENSYAGEISREYRIPCIVGTENAASVFKDDDMLIVDAEIGVVRKI